MTNQSPPAKIILATAAIVSGLLWYFTNHLSGNFGFLLWIAPLPILLISFKTKGKTVFLFAFIAYLIGRLSWVTYLAQLIPLVPIIIVTKIGRAHV